MAVFDSTNVVVGALVTSLEHRELGIGKVARATEEAVAIEYFDSVANPVALRADAPRARVLTAYLERQLRVYYRSGRDWRVGRVIDTELGRVRVRPPGHAQDKWLGIDEVYVRWDKPLEDPVGIMQARALEAPHHYFSRREFVDAMLEEDAASRGNRALTSSAIGLHDHQIRVATRVLSDPVRRFLLADEVGMGKTIEAGLVIRQYLLDNPHAVIRVVAPARLCQQWDRELRDRFFVTDPLDSTVLPVMASNTPEAWAVASDRATPDLLVIDEAHHVAAWARGSDADVERFELAARIAHMTPSLLLLSATPVAANEETFLAMLNLLDPDNYALEDIDSFRRRVENRHELARAFVLFREGQSYRRMSRNADRLRELLAGDDASIALLEELIESGHDAPQDELDRHIRALRVAISDRHRIHYRMLRNRRDETRGFAIRGRRLEALLQTECASAGDLSAWLDRWRNALIADAQSTDSNWASVARTMFDRALAFPDVLAVAVRQRLEAGPGASVPAPGEADPEALASYRAGPEEREVLEAWSEYHVDTLAAERTKAIVDCVCDLRRPTKVVVFSSFTSTAIRLAAALASELAKDRLALHIDVESGPASVTDGEAAIRRFRSDRNCTVLVCDSSAEEGLNLQFADVLVHADLPLDPNRLEQRIGRLDRHGEGVPVENIIVGDGTPGSYLDAWTAVLRDGFQVFERSISSFQFVVDRIMPELVGALVEGGPAGCETVVEGIPERLEAERVEIAEQDQLDAIEAIDLTHPVADKLRDVGSRWDEFEVYHERLICSGKGQLCFPRRAHYEYADLYSYWEQDPLSGAEPLIPQRDLTAYMNGVLSYTDVERRQHVRYGSHDRDIVLKHPGARLWAAGDPFLDGLLRYVRERDDRGRAFAFWKQQSDLDDGTTIAALRADVIVEAGDVTGDAWPDSARAVLRRRAEGFLPAVVESVWIGPDLAEITDAALIRRLSGKYSSDFGDVHLHSGNWEPVERALGGQDWEAWCAHARDIAEQVARNRASVEERTQVARADAARDAQARVEALRGRQRLTADSALALDDEEHALTGVHASIDGAKFVVDAMGLVILSSHRPESTHDE